MIGDRIKALRKRCGMTLEELAAATGTSRQNIHRYENGTVTNIPPARIEAIAAALGTAPAALYGWEDSSVRDIGGEHIPVKRLPILGRIACGEPILASEDRAGYVLADGNIDADFVLRASGDSMTGARIYDGDLVFIRSQSAVDNGEIAAVIISDEATLKRVYYYPEEEKLILSPENPKYAPLVYIKNELSEVKILGKAIAFQSVVR
jgi:repressor LexA